MKRSNWMLVAGLVATAGLLSAQTAQERSPASTEIPLKLEKGKTLAYDVAVRGQETPKNLTDATKEPQEGGDNVAKAKERSGDMSMNLAINVTEKTEAQTTLQVNATEKQGSSSAGGAPGAAAGATECRFKVVVDAKGIIQRFEREQPSGAADASGTQDDDKEEHIRCFLTAILGSGLHGKTLIENGTYTIGAEQDATTRPNPSDRALRREVGADQPSMSHDEKLLPIVVEFTGETGKQARFSVVALGDEKMVRELPAGDKPAGDKPAPKKPTGSTASGEITYSIEEGVLENLTCRCEGKTPSDTSGSTTPKGAVSLTIRRIQGSSR